MTVKKQDRRIEYVAGAGQTVFGYPFRIFEDGDLNVYQNEVLLSLTVDYTVTGVNDDDGGTVVLNVGAALNDSIIIQSNVPPDQTVDFTVGGEFSPDTVDFTHDKLTVLIQQNKSLIEDRGLLYPENEDIESGDNNLPLLGVPSATGRIPIWSKNAAGNLIATELVEDEDVSTLRAELADQSMGSDGARLVGYYNPVAASGTTVSDQLDILVGSIIPISFTTGDIKPTWKSTADAGWIMMDDGTIGNAASGATTRANADTEDLFTLFWDNIVDEWCPVSGGRGASAAADFAANKTIRLPQTSGRSMSDAGLANYNQTFTADAGTDLLTVAYDWYETGLAVQVATTGTLPTPLVASTTYYAIRISTTTLKLASSAANAVAGVAINLTTNGSGTLTIFEALNTNNALGQFRGFEKHALAASEMAPHTHTYTRWSIQEKRDTGGDGAYWTNNSTQNTSAGTGLNSTPFNIVSPSFYCNFMVKL